MLYDRNIIGTSLEIFGYLQQPSAIFGKCSAFGTILENLWKASESGRKSSESRQKHRYWYVYIITRIIHGRLEIWNLSSRVHIRYLTRSLHSLVRYRCEHSKINSISPRAHVLFSIYIIFKSMHALWLVNQLWFIVPVNPWKNRVFSELQPLYIKSIDHKFLWFIGW